MAKEVDEQYRIRPWQHCALFLFACVLVTSRRPDALFHPQFWAEDGRVWFADAYNLGWWPALFRPETGYFQTLPRLAAASALVVPLSLAPLVLNLAAIALQALPVNLLLSIRSSAWGNLRFRALLAITYIALPSSPEIAANITNSQWMLAFFVFLLLVASPAKSIAGRGFDVFMVLLCGLTGPFCFFLLPIAMIVAFERRSRQCWIPVCILAASSLIQAWGLLIVSPTARSAWGALGANSTLFVRILAGNVFLGAMLGANKLAVIPGRSFFLFLLFAAVGGTAIVAIAVVKSSIEMRLFILLACMTLAACLISPSSYAPPGHTQWELVAGASAVRYWFLPTLAFVWSLLKCFQNRSLVLKSAVAALLCLLCFGIALRWRRPAFQDFHFAEAAKRVEAAPAGTVITIPENPDGWHLRLVKRPNG